MKCLELLFPKAESTKTSLILLASRLVFGLTFASHGLDKLQHFSETAAHFPAPFRMSGEVAVGLSIFGELVCGLAFVFKEIVKIAFYHFADLEIYLQTNSAKHLFSHKKQYFSSPSQLYNNQ